MEHSQDGESLRTEWQKYEEEEHPDSVCDRSLESARTGKSPVFPLKSEGI